MKEYLSVIPLALLLCFVVGCQDKAEKAELEKFRAQAKVEEQNKEIVRRYEEAEDKGKLLDVLDELVAPDAIFHYPNKDDIVGLETIKRSVPDSENIFMDVRHIVEFQCADGDLVTTRFAWYGTHKGEWMGVAPTGKEISFTVNEVCRFSNGKIVEAWIEVDWLGAMLQLGMELKPKETEKK
jgi:predicted ester cyclase